MSLDNRGFIDLTKLSRKDYSRLYLVSNPFPSTAIPSDVPLITADRQAALRRFSDVLSSLYTDNSSSSTVLLGDYGSGKSHLLKLFRSSVNEQLLESESPILAVYARSPGRSMRDLFLYLVDDIGRDFLTTHAVDSIFEFITKSDPKKYLPRGTEFTLKDVAHLPEYLEKATWIDLVDDMMPKFDRVGNLDLVRSFLTLPHPEYGAIAWRWLVGSSLSKDERGKLKLDSTIDDAHTAEAILNSLLRLMWSLGFSGLVMLIDELEAISLIPGLGKGLYQDALRHLIDNNPHGLVVIFSITIDAWEKLTETPSALERRLAGSVQDLAPFTRDEVRELVEKYLSIARPKDYERFEQSIRQLHDTDPQIFPFAKDGPDFIFSATQGVVHKVVTLCRLCIENLAVSSDQIADSHFIKIVIKKEGFR